MEEELICHVCGWTGDVTMLVSETSAADGPCNQCPDCGGEDIEDSE